MHNYDFVIIGAGICGCSIAYELSQSNKKILLIDKLEDVASGASGAAGAFLSPLLGKPNDFKDLVTNSLKYSTEFYKTNFSNYIDTCGTNRIPKDEDDQKKFESYIPYMDFDYVKENDGYFFDIGSVVDSYGICKSMIDNKNIDTKFNYEVSSLKYEDSLWYINDDITASKVILTTGAHTNIIDEFYINIRAVWGRRIDITTTTNVEHNYHKECSISKSINNEEKNVVSIGATHHRDKSGVEDIESNHENLLKKAANILKLDDIEIINDYVGARACSVDYMPIVGELIDSKKTLQQFPYLVDGTNVQDERFTMYQNLFIINGVGGRGFVLAPYLAKELKSHIIDGKDIDKKLLSNRLFKRDVRRIKK